MHRTVFLVHTLEKSREGYPRVYYGNGVRRVDNDTVFEEVKHLKTREDFELQIRFLGMNAQPPGDLAVEALVEMEEFVEIFFDFDGKNPSYRFLDVSDEMLKGID